MAKPRRIRRAIGAFMVVVTVAVAVIMCVVAGFAGVIVRQAESELPTPVAIRARQLEHDLIFVDRYGERIIAVARGDAHREVISLDALPPFLRDAVVASEDARFWTHRGLDPLGIARAAIANITNGRRAQGGSTITQQLLKFFLLRGRPRLLRKVEEVMLASSFESLLTKEELLELYLNAVYLGGGNAGVEAASQDLFGIPAAQLTRAEAALLVGAISAPSARSPFCAPGAARLRQRQVLERMVAERMLTPDAAHAAGREGIRFRLADDEPDAFDVASAADAIGTDWPSNSDRVETTIDFPLQCAAARALRRGLESYAGSRGEHRGPRFIIASTARERWRANIRQLRADLAAWGTGASSVLVYDLRHVRIAAEPPAPCRYGSTIFRHAEPRGFASGIVIAVSGDTATVDLGDLTGTISRSSVAWTGKLLPAVAPVGAVVDVRLPAKLPGAVGASVAVELIPRPIVEGAVVVLNPQTRELLTAVGGNESAPGGYHRAFRARRPIGSAVKPFVFAAALGSGSLDLTSEMHDVPYRYVDPWSGLLWEPENWYPDHLGTISLYEAIARSVNMAAIEATFVTGVDRVATFFEEVSPVAPVPRLPAIALGAFERTPLELAAAYAVFASGGYERPIRTVNRVWRGGAVVTTPEEPARQILDPSVVQAADWLLTQSVEHPNGTARSLARLGLGIRGKTGTTDGARDAWFVGYVHELLVAVWIGYDQPAPLRSRRGEESGGSIAVPVAREIFAQAIAMRRIAQPTAPPVFPESIRAGGPDASVAFRAAFASMEEVMP